MRSTERASIGVLRTLSLGIVLLVLGLGLVACSGEGNQQASNDMAQQQQTSESKTSPTEGTVKSIEQADRAIQAEKSVRNYRIGATLTEPAAIYSDTTTASEVGDATHQLRILLREKRTKRFLPGAEIQAVFQGSGGDEVLELDLLETYGPYHFYGQNLRFPENATSLSVTVNPPRVGRHAGMKEQYIKPASTSFELVSNDTGTKIQGPRPQPVPEDVTLGSDVATALEETLATKVHAPYRIGFIVEHAEPFWVFDTYRTDDANTSFNVRLADIPQSANRHLEIVLFDQQTNRIIPHAGINLNVKSKDGNAETQVELPFLLAAFNHYGNSVYLPANDYTVEATIQAPAIHTLKNGQFPKSRSVTFDWTAKPAESGKSGDHHENEEGH